MISGSCGGQIQPPGNQVVKTRCKGQDFYVTYFNTEIRNSIFSPCHLATFFDILWFTSTVTP